MTIKKSNRASVDVQEPLFFKWQVLNSAKLNVSPDVLNALLDDNKQYTLTEVKRQVEEFLKRKA